MIYPNLAYDVVKIIANDISLKQISVYNNYGQLIEERIVKQEEDIAWNASSYAAGLYQMVDIDVNGNRWVQKIVVQ